MRPPAVVGCARFLSLPNLEARKAFATKIVRSVRGAFSNVSQEDNKKKLHLLRSFVVQDVALQMPIPKLALYLLFFAGRSPTPYVTLQCAMLDFVFPSSFFLLRSIAMTGRVGMWGMGEREAGSQKIRGSARRMCEGRCGRVYKLTQG